MQRRDEGGAGPEGLAWLLLAAAAVVFALNVHAHAFLGDDAFISFRYAKHVADGLGPVWNPGERVEGYTNFLWVVLLAGGIRLGFAPELVSQALGVAAGLGVLATLAGAARRRRGRMDLWVALAILALASHRSFAAWSSGGLETQLFSLLVLSGLLTFDAEREREASHPWRSSAIFAAATLTRPEGALFFAVTASFFVGDLARGKGSRGAFIAWCAPFGSIVGAHVAWRFVYYGAWVPNTFTAKVAGPWWDQGLAYLGLYATDYRVAPFLPLLLLPLVWRSDRLARLFGACLVGFLTYLAGIGGDRFEFRFLVPLLPLCYWLTAEGLRRVASERPWRTGLAATCGLGLLVTSALPALAPPPPPDRSGVASLERVRGYAEARVAEGRFLRSLIDDGLLPADLVLCVGGAGAVPYYTDWPTVDRRGLNDTTIARLPLTRRGVVGHERDAPLAYLRERGVAVFDVLNQLIHPPQSAGKFPPTVMHDGEPIPLHALPVRGRLLVFASPSGSLDPALARSLGVESAPRGRGL